MAYTECHVCGKSAYCDECPSCGLSTCDACFKMIEGPIDVLDEGPFCADCVQRAQLLPWARSEDKDD